MAQILSFNGYTRPAEQEKPEIIKAIDNSRYHGLIAGGGKYADEWDQIIRYNKTRKSDLFRLLLDIYAFGCMTGKREEREKKRRVETTRQRH
jgi:hypothetical protein